MAQFDVYENTNPETGHLFPYLLDVQADMLENLPTRVIVPLMNRAAIRTPIAVLNPLLKIRHAEVIMLTPQLVGIQVGLLGTKVCSVKDRRDVIIAALDLMFTGY